jgi:cyclopropane-fatty-acyl-phospholipid synthase
MLKSLIQLAEKGILPDLFIRFGIRSLCRKRLGWAKKLGHEALEDDHHLWVEKLKKSPIALVPEKANEQHYEVPPDFFEQVLGKHLKYSSGYWSDGIDTLDQSEKAMLDITCRRADLKDGMNILELGSGWGSLTCFMAKLLPNATITTVSNSQDQGEYIINRCHQSDIKNVNVITADMNDFKIDDVFDRVVSVEMFEHMRNYQKLLRKIHSFLKPEGKLFVHIFSHKLLLYPFEDNGPSDWMSREFFSGGLMPSHRLLLHFQKDLNIEKVWRISGTHYSQTSWAWLEKMDQRKANIIDIFSKTYGYKNAKIWWQRWRIFFMSCAELFGINHGNEWGVSHYLFVKGNSK